MKEINVFGMTLQGAVQIAHAHGEAILDADEGVLIIHGADARTSMTFNWNNVLNYTETPIKEATNG